MQRLEDLPAAEPELARADSPVRSRGGKRRLWPVALVAAAAAVAVSAAAAVVLHVAKPSFSASTSRVVTEASPSHVTIAENTLDVSPESGIVVREEEHATVLTLERGEVSLHVAPREKDRPFLVEAGDVHVRVVGTEFTVRRVGIGATVSVTRGVVEVREHGDLARLTAGDHWPASPKTDTPAVNPTPTPTPTLTSTPIAARQESRLRPTITPPLAPPRPPSRFAERVKQGGEIAGHPSASIDSPALPAARGTGGAVIAEPPLALAAVPPAADPTPLPAPEPTAQSKYEAAAQLERTDPARALRLYTDLAQGSDAWAQNALYAAGRLQADRGARTDAARLLEEYLRRFPRGSNAQDARALRESLRSSP
jgi:hypothetical protein